ncbi:DUF5908 family protein [Roseivirga sp. BDSF3-8]|uniref:DUF5908 family protein n=1 Tax=Roseivirga sp. BDSF3-8 TaxID=3241598 RepID=UPI003532020A
MTLQIKELSVKIKVTEESHLHTAARNAALSFTKEDKDQLIEECIERVLEKLELQNQR